MFSILFLVLTSLVITGICSFLLSAIATAETEKLSVKTDIEIQPSRFFAADITPAVDPRAIPVEMLLNQIELHVRLEQAAAERFVRIPTIESLQAPTGSRFVN